jgi:hypothetical protein
MSGELARAVREWNERQLAYDDDKTILRRKSIPISCVGSGWFLSALPLPARSKHLTAIAHDERVPIPQRVKE